MDAPIIPLDQSRHAYDLRYSWQGRALGHAPTYIVDGRPRLSAFQVILLSVLAHNFDDAMPVLLRVVFPGFESIGPPFLCSAARVAHTGAIVADVVWRDETISKDFPIFASEKHCRDRFREFADKMKFDDSERKQLFAAVQRWIVADRRLDPTFDPQDPDAKRIKH